MRLFVALRIPDPVAQHLDDALRDVRAAHPELRWIPAQRWHLTLVFFGEVAPGNLDRLRGRVTRRVVGHPPLDLRLADAGRFDSRVLWIGLTGEVARLVALGERLAVEERSYRPHLTVARARDRVDLRPVVERLRDYVGPAWTATQLELISANLGPRPTYETIEVWPLTHPSPAQ